MKVAENSGLISRDEWQSMNVGKIQSSISTWYAAFSGSESAVIQRKILLSRGAAKSMMQAAVLALNGPDILSCQSC